MYFELLDENKNRKHTSETTIIIAWCECEYDIIFFIVVLLCDLVYSNHEFNVQRY